MYAETCIKLKVRNSKHRSLKIAVTKKLVNFFYLHETFDQGPKGVKGLLILKKGKIIIKQLKSHFQPFCPCNRLLKVLDTKSNTFLVILPKLKIIAIVPKKKYRH